MSYNLNPAELKKFSGAIEEITIAMTHIKSQQDLIAEITKEMREKFGIETKDTRDIAKIAFNRSLDEERTKAESLFDLCAQIIKE
jgi:hypothetical protein